MTPRKITQQEPYSLQIFYTHKALLTSHFFTSLRVKHTDDLPTYLHTYTPHLTSSHLTSPHLPSILYIKIRISKKNPPPHTHTTTTTKLASRSYISFIYLVHRYIYGASECKTRHARAEEWLCEGMVWYGIFEGMENGGMGGVFVELGVWMDWIGLVWMD